MKDYSEEKKIIELLQEYKKVKKDNALLTPTQIKKQTMKEMFEKEQIVSKEEFENLLKKMDEISTALKDDKKKGVENEENIKKIIGEIVTEDVQENQKEKELIFTGIGTVRCTFEKKYLNQMTTDQKANLINECIANGDIDILDISDENLFEMDKRIYIATGEHLPGVTCVREIETKISVR